MDLQKPNRINWNDIISKNNISIQNQHRYMITNRESVIFDSYKQDITSTSGRNYVGFFKTSRIHQDFNLKIKSEQVVGEDPESGEDYRKIVQKTNKICSKDQPIVPKMEVSEYKLIKIDNDPDELIEERGKTISSFEELLKTDPRIKFWYKRKLPITMIYSEDLKVFRPWDDKGKVLNQPKTFLMVIGKSMKLRIEQKREESRLVVSKFLDDLIGGESCDDLLKRKECGLEIVDDTTGVVSRMKRIVKDDEINGLEENEDCLLVRVKKMVKMEEMNEEKKLERIETVPDIPFFGRQIRNSWPVFSGNIGFPSRVRINNVPDINHLSQLENLCHRARNSNYSDPLLPGRIHFQSWQNPINYFPQKIDSTHDINYLIAKNLEKISSLISINQNQNLFILPKLIKRKRKGPSINTAKKQKIQSNNSIVPFGGMVQINTPKNQNPTVDFFCPHQEKDCNIINKANETIEFLNSQENLSKPKYYDMPDLTPLPEEDISHSKDIPENKTKEKYITKHSEESKYNQDEKKIRQKEKHIKKRSEESKDNRDEMKKCKKERSESKKNRDEKEKHKHKNHKENDKKNTHKKKHDKEKRSGKHSRRDEKKEQSVLEKERIQNSDKHRKKSHEKKRIEKLIVQKSADGKLSIKKPNDHTR